MWIYGLTVASIVATFVSCRTASNDAETDLNAEAEKVVPFSDDLTIGADKHIQNALKKIGYTWVSDRDCMTAVAKPGDRDHVWFQYYRFGCKQTDKLIPENVYFELVGSSQNYAIDPSKVKTPVQKAFVEQMRRLMKDFPLENLRAGYLYIPEYPDVEIGMWSEMYDNQKPPKRFITFSALCGPKPPLSMPPHPLNMKMDFTGNCEIQIKDGYLEAIISKNPSGYGRNQELAHSQNKYDWQKEVASSSQSNGSQEKSQPRYKDNRDGGYNSGKDNCSVLSCYTCTYSDYHNNPFVFSHAIEFVAKNSALRACWANSAGCRFRSCYEDSVAYDRLSGRESNRSEESNDPDQYSNSQGSSFRSLFINDWTCRYKSFTGIVYSYTHPWESVAKTKAYWACVSDGAICTFAGCDR